MSDYFGYFAAANAAAGSHISGPATHVRRDDEENTVVRDVLARERRELFELRRRLHERFPRRRMFRRGDVDQVIRDMIWPEELPALAPRNVRPRLEPAPMVDLTEIENVIE